MSGPAAAGVLIYAKNRDLLAQFYTQILGMRELHRRDEIVVLESEHFQLVIHAIPASIAEHVHVSTPPVRRENVALKFFATIDSIAAVRALAAQLGGQVFDELWHGPGFVACNAMDSEGNVFQMRAPAGAAM
ncbi:MAG: glyoxalase/bleomycin resistance/dioxygenase family protein [Comamonas sp.]|jgi:predicted enzyme related to lactoylglutathione lyase